MTEYNENVLKAVAGSGADNTYGKVAAEKAAVIEAFVDKLKERGPDGTYPTYTIDRNDPMVLTLKDIVSNLRVAAHAADTAINGLGVYADKAFYSDVKPQTKAAEDQGAHAGWILRMVVPGAT